MRKYILFLFFLFLFFLFLFQDLYSQEYHPDMTKGIQMDYLFDLHEQKRPIILNIKIQSDSLIIDWNLRGVYGRYKILPEAFSNGNQMSFKQGIPLQALQLAPNETFCTISRSAFQYLIKNHHFVYNETTYVADDTDDPVRANGKMLRTIHVTAQIDETEMWILDDPDFPVVVRMIKNPLGINFILTSVSGG